MRSMSESETRQPVGCTSLEVIDSAQGVALPAWLLYPAARDAEEASEHFGPFELRAAKDAAPAEPRDDDGVPLAVISHGNTSSPWVFRGLAASLARAGYAVAMLEHLGNSRSDQRLTGTLADLQNRPRHLRLTIDAALAAPRVGAKLRADRVAVIGHSLGGYTALALAGGRPMCLPNESPDGQAHPVEVERDPRVGALVLLAPATIWFLMEGSLAEVTAPMLMLTGERDDQTPPIHAEIVRRECGLDLSRKHLTHHIVRSAGHFSFQSPFPPSMVRSDFPPSQDPAGFDRAAYQPTMHAEVLRFLRESLSPARPRPSDAPASRA